MGKIPRKHLSQNAFFLVYKVVFSLFTLFAYVKFADVISLTFSPDENSFSSLGTNILALISTVFFICLMLFFDYKLQDKTLKKSLIYKPIFIVYAIIILGYNSILAMFFFVLSVAAYNIFEKFYLNKKAKYSYNYSYEISLIKARKETHFLAEMPMIYDKFQFDKNSLILSCFAKSLKYFLAFLVALILILLGKNNIDVAVLTSLFTLTSLL